MKKLLHLGLRPPNPEPGWEVVHYPVIKIAPHPHLQCELAQLSYFTHIILTSQTTVEVLHQQDLVPHLVHLPAIVVGAATAQAAKEAGWEKVHTAKDPTAEGVAAELPKHLSPKDYVFWPHARRARPVLKDFLDAQGISYHHCTAYDTHLQEPGPPPDLSAFHALHFTSPSTVDGFFALYTTLPTHLDVRCIGPITSNYLEQQVRSSGLYC